MAKPKKIATPPKTQKPVSKNPVKYEYLAPRYNPETDKKFLIITLGAFILIGLIGVFHHEMWRDELQTWLVGASSNTFGEFLHNMKTECNPLLWYTSDFVLSRFTKNPIIAQFYHLVLSIGTVYLILRYGPFTHLQKVLLSFSYFIFFEYSLVARGYGMTIFFIFLFCAVYQQSKSKYRYPILALILICISNTTGHGIIMTLSFLAFMGADYFFSEDSAIRKKYKPSQLFIAGTATLIGIYIAFKCITPPANSVYTNNWFLTFDSHRMAVSLRTFWMSLFPIPHTSGVNFWNSNMLYSTDDTSPLFTLLFLISLSIFFFCVLFYSKKISAAAFYLAATTGVLLFNYTNNVIFRIYAANHYGFIFITFAVAAWLAADVKKTTFSLSMFNSLRTKLKVEKNFTWLVTALFAINTLGGAIAYSKDYANVFSNIKPAGNYIMTNHLEHLPEVGFIDYAVSPISAFTQQPIYFPDRDTTGRFTTWSVTRASFDPKVLLARTTNFIAHQPDSVLFISTGDYFGIGDERVINNIQYKRIASFDGAIVGDENYILYMARNFNLDKMLNDSASFKNIGNASAVVSSANDLIQAGKLDEAEKILNTVQRNSNGTAIPHLHSYFGMLYTKKNMLKEAEEQFRTEISLKLEKEEAFFNLGILYFQNKDYKNALVNWDSTVHINTKNDNAYNNMGVCYLNLNGDNFKAKECFEKSVAANPNYTQGYYNLIVCAQNTHDEESVIKYVRVLLSKGASLNDITAKGINISDDLLKKITAK